METAKIALQLIVGLGILNVWLLRFNKKTATGVQRPLI